MTQAPSLAVVVPCYNEEEVLSETFSVLDGVLSSLVDKQKISPESKLYFVDDGSKDKTWEILEAKAQQDGRVVAIKLSRNKGHQNALYAGLCSTVEDLVVSIDADLQDGPENIEAMVDENAKGYEVVYGVRSERKTDTFFKRFTAEGYYHLMRKMGVDLVFNHADFRLMSRKALNAFKEYPEANLFLRGIVREVGFSSSKVEYERKERFAGESKYPLRKMLSFAWEGISSFSTVPLRAITIMGFIAGLMSLAMIAWVLGVRVFTDSAIPGWASILLPLLFIGSVQLMCLGILGEYMAKIYAEVKARPKYHIDQVSKKG
ncbi:MAG TPA: glycosyltransferase family 2 protein [Marinagarivorans sp.]